MALPTICFRAAPEHHQLLRDVARALKENPAVAGAIQAALVGPSDVGLVLRVEELESCLAVLVARIDELEARR